MNQQTSCIYEESVCANDKRRTSSVASNLSESLNKANIILTDRGHQRYGTWSTDKLLELIRSKLKRTVESQQNGQKRVDETTNEKRLWVTIHSGLYSTLILKKLLKKGMSIHAIIKAMKLGIINLSSCELSYFKSFNIDQYALEFEDMWTHNSSCELISNLRAIGVSEPDCWNIILHGVGLQSACVLRHLLLSGIDVPGILNWQSPVNQSSEKIILFLKQIGIERELIELVEQYGINEETEQILTDLGLDQMEEECFNEIICKCSLSVLEPDNYNLGTTQSINKSSEPDSVSTYDKIDNIQHECQCGNTMEKMTIGEFTAQRNDYIRQNIMVPAAWAMARTLRYNPTDFIYYMAYQLLHWKCVNHQKQQTINNVIALATMKMDRELIKNREKEELIKNKNKETLVNIPCLRCMQHQELNLIKKACPKCIKRPLKKSGECEFPEICSSCKIEPSGKHAACQFSQLCSSCKLIERPPTKSEDYRFPDCYSSCKITNSPLKKCEIHRLPKSYSPCKIADSSPEKFQCQLPQLCSSCRINDIQSKTFEQCQFPQHCSSSKIPDSPSKDLEPCQFPQVCSSCEITEKPLMNLEACDFPDVCSSCDITERPLNNFRCQSTLL